MSANPFQSDGNWLAEKTGCLSGSRAADALDFTKDGKPGAKRKALIKTLAAEQMTGIINRNIVLPRMEYGLAREPDARNCYELRTGRLVQLVGFVTHPDIDWCGVSPDGLVGDDGLIEIKVPETTTHISYIADGTVPAQYKPQMLLQIAVTQRKWCDFVSFDDRIKTEKSHLFVCRFEPSMEEIQRMEQAARDVLKEVETLVQTVTHYEMEAA